ncbi:transcriptional regulator [Kitasatospora sp. NPDC051914]|uniref:MmyB family transcriptional regulator n=1 Tax=Kitasatospora sp. NPDC051914 TaxID=3154945 RepID=UPI003430EB93
MLEAVARALRLDDEAVAHLFRVAGPSTRRTRRAPHVERVAPHLRRLLDTWSGTPAFVLGPALDVLARNRLASALHAGFTQPDNLLRMTFLDPAARHFHLDWDRAAESTVAALRRSAGIDPDDPRLSQLVGELSVKSADFRVLWARHDVRGKTREAKLFHHAEVGDLELHYESFTVDSAPLSSSSSTKPNRAAPPPTPSPCSARSVPAPCPHRTRRRASSPTEGALAAVRDPAPTPRFPGVPGWPTAPHLG